MNKAAQESPEETGIYACSKCGNDRAFIGYDYHGYPGRGCACHELSEEVTECRHDVVLAQPFTVIRQGGFLEHADLYYECHNGGEDSEIGNYDRIDCAKCGHILWQETPRPDPVELLQGPSELGRSSMARRTSRKM
jgi:hypothetical protein